MLKRLFLLLLFTWGGHRVAAQLPEIARLVHRNNKDYVAYTYKNIQKEVLIQGSFDTAVLDDKLL